MIYKTPHRKPKLEQQEHLRYKTFIKEDRYAESSFGILFSIIRVPDMEWGCHQSLASTKHDENANYVQNI